MDKPPLQSTGTKKSLYRLPLNKSLLKPFFMFCGITLVICAFYLQRNSKIDNGNIFRYDRLLPPYNSTKHSNSSVTIKKENQSARRPGKKIFIAFDYWEQLTMATNNFLHLTALAAYGERQVVLPFVKDSRFYGVPTEEGLETLALYFNVSALNRMLRSRGHGTLVSWKEFQVLCQGKLDILVHFDYKNLTESKKCNRTKGIVFPCKVRKRNTFGDLKVERTICMNVFQVNSIEKFENEVIERLPCVGLAEWRGSNKERSFRAQFKLSEVVSHRMRVRDAAFFFS